jgi:hypothetical protein
MLKSMILSATLLFSVNIWANENTGPMNIGDLKLKVELIHEGMEPLSHERLKSGVCSSERYTLEEIMTVGEKVWQIVKDGAPSLEFTANSASAIPGEAGCPFNLAGWSVPYSKTYRITYTNFYGMNVVDFTYKVIYSYGGSFKGKGAYLTNVSVHPGDIHVMWGHNFNAIVSIADALNTGTETDPVAGMQVTVEWNVENILNKFKSQRSYFVDGLGNASELN